MIKGLIQGIEITIVNFYAPPIIRAPQYIRQTSSNTKGENNNNTIIVGKFNIPLTSMDRSSRQKISKEIQVTH